MSIYEIIMLICFGAAWPFSIYKSWKTKDSSGKSRSFFIIVIIGYIAGIMHKIYYHFDMVIILYIINALMVTTDLMLFFRNQKLHKQAALLEPQKP